MSPRRRPEQTIRLACKKLLKQVGFAVYDTEQNRQTRVTPGIPDLIALGHGMTIWAEIKTPTGRLTDHQKAFRNSVDDAEGSYVVWRSVEECWDWLVERGVIRNA